MSLRAKLCFYTMFGFYVHIPFCARRCPYCDFAVQIGGGAAGRTKYAAALQQEIAGVLREQSTLESQRELTSIFFGGGTPTELEIEQLRAILGTILDGIRVTPDAEITIEANPENLSEERLSALREAGFNRLSLGAQSFDHAALKTLGRVHAPQDIESVVALARSAGCQNVSLDLIYAVPGQSRASWQNTLRQAADLGVEHVSCYALTIEPQTAFARRAATGKILPLHDDAQSELMDDAEAILGKAGILRYEVSNYARRGFESRHNLNYWLGGDYLACGNGAHGHHAGHRWWNERAATRYVEKIEKSGSAREGEEFLTAPERLSEIVVLGLRLRAGFSLCEAARLLDFDVRGALQQGKAWRILTEQGLLSEDKGNLRLAPAALAVADAIALRLLA